MLAIPAGSSLIGLSSVRCARGVGNTSTFHTPQKKSHILSSFQNNENKSVPGEKPFL